MLPHINKNIMKSHNPKQEIGKHERTSQRFAYQILVFLLPLMLIFTLAIVFSINSYGQIQVPKSPTFEKQTPINATYGYQTLKQNRPKTNGTTVYENDLRRQRAKQQMIRDIYREVEMITSKPAINYNLPSYKHISATSHYRTAFTELSKMTDSSFSVKRANFLVENAFYEDQGDYENFNKLISQIGQFLTWKMEELDYDENNNLHKNLILFQFFSDTLKIESKNLEHLPFKYEFDDYMGHNDWSNMFVEKLLKTNKGQCHSLPLLYLILAEEVNAKAYLSFSPNHSYIKFQDNNGKWINVELTNGMLTTDAFVLQSGYMKAEALQNKIYMQPLTEKQLLSEMMVDLAKGYSVKFGYDEFVEQVIDKAIELCPNNIFAHMVKSDYITLRVNYVTQQIRLKRENSQDLKYYPKAIELYKQRNEQYNLLDNLGYEDMPLEDYEKWLNSLTQAKSKQESKEMMIKLNQDIK